MFRIVFDSAWVALLAQGLNTRGTSKVARRGRVTEIIMHKVVQNNQQLKETFRNYLSGKHVIGISC